MNARKQSSNMSLCFKNGIKIYPIVYAKNKYKLVVERNGIAKEGNAVYPQESEYDRATNTLIKISVHEKIYELYHHMAQKIRENLNTTQNKDINKKSGIYGN